MKAPIQKRATQTRKRLLDAATSLVAEQGYGALRVEEVVLRAGVAKGTFFAHFPDKDALMDQLIGAQINAHLDALDTKPMPDQVTEVVTNLMPLVTFLTSERYVFDIVLRYSGAAAIEEIGDIAHTFERQIHLFARWMNSDTYRSDISPELLAEGLQAFVIQAVALNFCALHRAPMEARLGMYLDAWLCPVEGQGGKPFPNPQISCRSAQSET